MADLATLSEGTAIVVRGPNTHGAAVGGGRLLRGGRIAAQRQGLVFEPGGTTPVAGLAGSDYTTVLGINDTATVVGSANTAQAVRGFARSRAGAERELPPLPGDSASMAFAVNNAGLAVGYSSGPGGERAVSWTTGGASLLPTAGQVAARALGVNERGDVAGTLGQGSARRAALWRSGTTAQALLPLQGFASSEAAHVNGRGDVVGFSADEAGQRRATQWPAGGGAAVDLGALPGHTLSQAFGSNDAGQVVGYSGTSHATRAVLWSRDGGLQDLNSLVPASPFVLSRAIGINNAGMIIALGFERPAGDGHAHEPGQEHADEHEHELPVRVFLLTRSGG